jgi:hypothetical protein
MKHLASRRPLLPAAVLALLVPLGPAPGPHLLGDVLALSDGRRFEGTIIEETPTKVVIDAKVGSTRVKIGFQRFEIASVVKSPLPDDFFEEKPEAVKRVSDAGKFAPGTVLYLEVPIVGRFGVQVVPAGVRKCLMYAAQHRIEHVVFSIDSQGGDQVAAKEIYDLLAKHDEKLHYHALVRDSVGVAMAVTVWCDEVFLLPGANLGGVLLSTDTRREGEDPEVLLAQVAHNVGQTAGKHGWPAGLVEAMIDPRAEVAAWRDEKGGLVTGAQVPPSVPADRVVALDRSQSVLTLDRETAVGLGVAKAFSGNASQIGYTIGIESWKKESDLGREAMTDAARSQEKKLAREATRAEAEIERLVKRRDEVKRYTERVLAVAHSWDPEQGAFSTYAEHKERWDRYWSGDPVAGTMTRSKWREQTDATVQALQEAAKGAQELKRLDEKAKKLGVEPLHKEGELDKLLDDIAVKVTLLQWNRNRRTSATGGA